MSQASATYAPDDVADAQCLPLQHVMTRKVTTVRSDASLTKAADLMYARGIHGMPVVDELGRAIGMISRSDLARGARHRAVVLGATTVADVMMPLAFTLGEHATIADAATMMAVEDVHRIPVVRHDGVIVGIISSLDLARWIAQCVGTIPPRAQD